MNSHTANMEAVKPDVRVILVAVDFSHCSRLALQKAKSLLESRPGRVIALHVIDQEFIEKCIRHNLAPKSKIKKALFLHAKGELRALLREEGMEEDYVEPVVCEGVPYIEINKKAIESRAEMIVMGSRGKMGDMESIFFGSTTEKVLRFITRPVLCVPPEVDYRAEMEGI